MQSDYFNNSCAQCDRSFVKDGFCEKCYKWYRFIKKKLFCAMTVDEIRHVRFFTLKEAREHVKDGGSIVYERRRCYWKHDQFIPEIIYRYSDVEIHKRVK